MNVLCFSLTGLPSLLYGNVWRLKNRNPDLDIAESLFVNRFAISDKIIPRIFIQLT